MVEKVSDKSNTDNQPEAKKPKNDKVEDKPELVSEFFYSILQLDSNFDCF